MVAAILCFMCAFGAAGCNNNEEPAIPDPPLYFNENGEFVIVQFADFHEWAGKEGYKSRDDMLYTLSPLIEAYIRDVLDAIKPDFVVLTGDNIFNLSFLDRVHKVSAHTMTLIADIFEEKQVYWSYTFGNHDTEGGTTKEDYLKATSTYKYCLAGLEDGEYYKALSYEADETDYRAGNFSIPVYGKDKKSYAYNIFILDSGSYTYVPPSYLPYRYILDEQVDWYAAQALALKEANGGAVVPSVMFTHIPLFEHEEAYGQGGPSIGRWVGISPSTTRSKIVQRALEIGDMKAIFVGHNHYNSFTGFYAQGDKKIMMGITPQASCEGYEDTEETMYCRVITLKDNGSLTTYIHTNDISPSNPNGIFRNETLSCPA